MPDNDSVLLLYFGDQRMGTLHRIKAGNLKFRYDDKYRELPTAVPLSLSMSFIEKEHGHEKASPFLWGLLPDNELVIRRWAARFRVSASDCFGLLGGIGNDCAGAIRFLKPDAVDSVSKGGKLLLDTEQIEERLAELRRDPALGRISGDRGQFSLAGAQAKTAFQRRDNQWYLPWGSEATTHILKLPRPDLNGHVENEHFCQSLAKALGLRAATSEVMRFGNETAICLARYDRMVSGKKLLRIHQEDTCQALSIHPSGKYENEGGPGVSDIMKLLNRSSRPIEDRRRFMEAIVFNYLISGSDAHAKNYSLLLGVDGQVRLAPLYDLASLLPYVKQWKDQRFAMKIGPYYRDSQIRPRHFEKMARLCEFPYADLQKMIAEMAAKIPERVGSVLNDMNSRGLVHPILKALKKKLITRSKIVCKEF
ncbi:MAG: type II toxin-antitoxin system HipA family toxin [Opitutae bacterium]|nr:type II toxin-antitoxin system HipA family toxin [Opitutae bacterium]MBC9888595.1 type II toxin-antitoxin system HipA family toxin [Opitutae bacterium]